MPKSFHKNKTKIKALDLPQTSAQALPYDRLISMSYKRAIRGEGKKVVYFVGCDEVNLVKIGLALDPVKRIAQLQTGSPVKLRIRSLVYHVDDDFEKLLHQTFDYSRRWGEWFDVNEDILNFMEVFKFGNWGNPEIRKYGEISHLLIDK